MNKSEQIVGTTHAAHEARHLARKMQDVRDGKKCLKDIEDYLAKVKEEREVLISRFKDCWAYIGTRESGVLKYKEIPVLTKEEAKKHIYLTGYEICDFDYAKRVEASLQYSCVPAPTKEHVGICAMLLQAAINDLTWAIAELNAYLD